MTVDIPVENPWDDLVPWGCTAALITVEARVTAGTVDGGTDPATMSQQTPLYLRRTFMIISPVWLAHR